MPTILLIRHAENDYVRTGRLAGRLPEVHLNERGQQQAEALATRLAKVKIRAVYSSPLERAMETAGPIARQAGLKIIRRTNLTEIDYGTWQGRTLKQLRRRKLWPTVQNYPSLARFPDGESFGEAQIRISNELVAESAKHQPKDLIVAVSHADIIKLAAAYFMGLPLDQFQRLMIFPASITTLHIGDHGARLINLNLSQWDNQ
jgi:probable phosphomutase (TIGR03848 family)